MNQIIDDILSDLNDKLAVYHVNYNVQIMDDEFSVVLNKNEINDAELQGKNKITEQTITFNASNYQQHNRFIINSILNKAGLLAKIHARSCLIKRIDKKTCEEFLNLNHVLGYCNAYYKFGLYNKDKLVMVATFSKSRIMNEGAILYRSYELLRVSSEINVVVVGGLSKLLTHFINQYHVKHLMTYIDHKTNTGNAFLKYGFKQAPSNNTQSIKLIYNTLNF